MQNDDNSKIVDFLRGYYLFEAITEDQREQIAAHSSLISLNVGETLFYQGSLGESFYIIIEGTVKVHIGPHVFSTMHAGDSFGELSLLDNQTRSASVTAIEKTSLIEIVKEEFNRLLGIGTDFAQAMLRLMVKRNRTMNHLENQLAESHQKILHQNDEIEQRNEELKQQQETLKKLNQELLSLNAEKNNIIDLVAHDLRNPLTSSLCMTEMLLSQTESNDQSEAIELIHNSLTRMKNIVNQVLNVEVIESGKLNVNIIETRVDKVLHQVSLSLQPIAQQKEIVILNLFESVSMLTDANLIAQIAENLLSNAIKYSPFGSIVSISLHKSGDLIKMEVSDNGPGIAQEDAKKLFSRYSRTKNDPTAGESSVGLGLSIVHRYVTALGGEVWCESTPGKGSHFIVLFKD
ncbi:MAG: ATP-binding protein [Sphingobacteriia bacterium]|nr:ATP-binding protein [Sphingobacteriia bacterium]